MDYIVDHAMGYQWICGWNSSSGLPCSSRLMKITTHNDREAGICVCVHNSRRGDKWVTLPEALYAPLAWLDREVVLGPSECLPLYAHLWLRAFTMFALLPEKGGEKTNTWQWHRDFLCCSFRQWGFYNSVAEVTTTIAQCFFWKG